MHTASRALAVGVNTLVHFELAVRNTHIFAITGKTVVKN